MLIAASAQDPSTIDPQLLRRGRFGKTIFFEDPTPEEAADIIQKRTTNLACSSTYDPYLSEEGINYQQLADQTQGFTLSDLYHLVGDVVCKKIAEIRKGQEFQPFTTGDFEEVIKVTIAKKVRANCRLFYPKTRV